MSNAGADGSQKLAVEAKSKLTIDGNTHESAVTNVGGLTYEFKGAGTAKVFFKFLTLPNKVSVCIVFFASIFFFFCHY